jgi:hypothetical protein
MHYSIVGSPTLFTRRCTIQEWAAPPSSSVKSLFNSGQQPHPLHPSSHYSIVGSSPPSASVRSLFNSGQQPHPLHPSSHYSIVGSPTLFIRQVTIQYWAAPPSSSVKSLFNSGQPHPLHPSMHYSIVSSPTLFIRQVGSPSLFVRHFTIQKWAAPPSSSVKSLFNSGQPHPLHPSGHDSIVGSPTIDLGSHHSHHHQRFHHHRFPPPPPTPPITATSSTTSSTTNTTLQP